MKIIGKKEELSALTQVMEGDLKELIAGINCYVADVEKPEEDSPEWMEAKEYNKYILDLEDARLSKEALNELKELLDKDYKDDPKDFEDEFYWYYRDEPDISLISKHKTYDEYKDALLEDLYDYNFEYEGELVENLWQSWKGRHEDLFNKLLDDDEQYLYDCFLSYVVIDYKVEDLIAKGHLYVNIMPYQDNNLNAEGGCLHDTLDYLWKSANGELEDDDEYVESPVLTKLFKSQGYELPNIDWESDDPFIKTFYKEMLNADIEYTYSLFMVFLAEMSIEDYYNLRSGKSKMIFRSGTCGIFNAVHGSGSVLEVELEKPFEIDFSKEEDCYFEGSRIQVEGVQSYGYSVNSIYGLIGRAWSDTDYDMEDVEGSDK